MTDGVLAEINAPKEWDWERLWSAAPRVQKVGQPDAEPLSVFLQAGVVPRSAREDNHNQLGEDLSKYQVVQPGDLVFNKLRTWQGGLGVSTYHGIVSPAYFVCRPRGDWHPRYLHYLLLSSPYLAELTRLSKFMPPSQFDIPWEMLRALPLLRPSLDMQCRIADFLDAETSRLYALAAARKRIRDLLVLKRERMVEQILGLDASPLMIPLKYAVQSVSVGIVITPANWYVDDDGVPALRGVNIQPGHIDTSNIVQISHEGDRENVKSRLS